MKDLQIFSNDSFGEIRTIMKDGEVWFVAKDIAITLGYSNPQKAIRDHCKGVTNRSPLETAGGNQEVNIIPEKGVYRLIMRSNLPSAIQFQDWICDEVIPSIRKTGSYSIVPQTFREALLLAAKLEGEKEQLVLENQSLHDENIEKDNIIDTNKPKIETYERVIEYGDELYSMAKTAKLLKLSIFHDHKLKLMGRNLLFKFLKSEEILDNRNTPYQRFVNQGYFEVKVVENGYGRFSTTFTTSKGLAFIYKQYLKFLDNNGLTLEDVKTENIRFERIV